MKIGIDIRLIGKKQTGSEVYFFNLVKYLAAADKENEYYLYTDRNPKTDTSLKAEIDRLKLDNNFRIIFLDSPNRFWWNFWALPDHLRKNPVDVFHTQYIAPFWLPKKIKLVLTIHDISFNFFPEFIKKSDLFFLKTLMPRSIRRADKIITVSRNERRQIIDFYKIPAEKVDFTYNGVDFERFAKEFSTEEKEKIRAKYKLPEKFLLYVGTMQPRKNVPALVATLRSLYDKYGTGGLKLVIVGNRQARNFDERIDEAIKKYNLRNDVIFPGWVEDEDLPAFYKLADCFVFVSLYEGFGIPVVEAMAAGLPVVSSDKSCLPEVGGEAALYADPADSRKFASQINRILSDNNLRSELIKKGNELAQTYSWQKTAEKTLGIYRSLA